MKIGSKDKQAGRGYSVSANSAQKNVVAENLNQEDLVSEVWDTISPILIDTLNKIDIQPAKTKINNK